MERLQQARMVPDDRPPNLNTILLGERGFLDFGPTKFGGAQFLDKGAAAIGQGLAG